MTQDEIIEMAVKCGIIPWTKHEYIGDQKFAATDEGIDGDLASLIQFFQMATAQEREACAKVAESYEPRCETCPSGVSNAIRARGNT